MYGATDCAGYGQDLSCYCIVRTAKRCHRWLTLASVKFLTSEVADATSVD